MCESLILIAVGCVIVTEYDVVHPLPSFIVIVCAPTETLLYVLDVPILL